MHRGPHEDHRSSRSSERYYTPPPPLPPLSWPDKRSQKICRYFANGTCNRGDACRFRHLSPRIAFKEDIEPVKREETDRRIGIKTKRDIIEDVIDDMRGILSCPGKKKIVVTVEDDEAKSKEFIIHTDT